MTRLLALVSCLWMAFVPPASAQSSPVVVELFTSQGCSSCPPADEILGQLAKRPDVIALSLHVDYWDYIGWKDAFARPEHTARQKAYAMKGRRNSIYTPQMVVNGQDDIVGARAMDLADAIARHAAQAPKAVLTALRQGDRLVIEGRLLGAPTQTPLVVHLVRYTPKREVSITRGENAGKNLVYNNIVDGWTILGEWSGRDPLTMTANLDGDRPAAVLIQYEDTGAIIAAARID